MSKATPTAEQRRLVALWRRSTLSRAAFARAHGVHPGTFASWVTRHDSTLEAPAQSPSTAFVQVTRPPVTASPGTFVVYVDELALRFDELPSPAWFAAVLRGLAPC